MSSLSLFFEASARATSCIVHCHTLQTILSCLTTPPLPSLTASLCSSLEQTRASLSLLSPLEQQQLPLSLSRRTHSGARVRCLLRAQISLSLPRLQLLSRCVRPLHPRRSQCACTGTRVRFLQQRQPAPAASSRSSVTSQRACTGPRLSMRACVVGGRLFLCISRACAAGKRL